MEQVRAQSASPTPKIGRAASASPTPTSRSVPNGKPFPRRKPFPPPRTVSNNAINNGNDYNNQGGNMGGNPAPLRGEFIRHQPGVSHIIYPQKSESHNSLFLSTFKVQPNSQSNNRHGSLDNNLNNIAKPNSNLSNRFGSSDKIQNYTAYQEPLDLVPIAIKSDMYHKLNQQQLEQQKLFKKYSMLEQEKLKNKERFKSENYSQLYQNKVVKNANIKDDSFNCSNVASDEQWIDGPRLHKPQIVSSTSHQLSNKNESKETWVDGPQVSVQSNSTHNSAATSTCQTSSSYGYMDDVKKTMIERWVEVQTARVVCKIDANSQTTDVHRPSKLPVPENSKIKVCSEITQSKIIVSNSSNPFNLGEESSCCSDVETFNEDSSTNGNLDNGPPNFIKQLEEKNLISKEQYNPSLDHINVSSADETRNVSDSSTRGRNSPTTSNGCDPSADEMCSECEALAEGMYDVNMCIISKIDVHVNNFSRTGSF